MSGAEPSTLDTEGRDFSSRQPAARFKGVDTSRITVLNVSGRQRAPAGRHHDRDQFRLSRLLRFVDGALATLVVFDHGH